MASHSLFFFLSLFLLLLLAIQTASSWALLSLPDLNPSYHKAKSVSNSILGYEGSVLKGIGFQGEDLRISRFDVKDAQVGLGHSVAYEFDVEINNKV
jgi:hypothetical protein